MNDHGLVLCGQIPFGHATVELLDRQTEELLHLFGDVRARFFRAQFEADPFPDVAAGGGPLRAVQMVKILVVGVAGARRVGREVHQVRAVRFRLIMGGDRFAVCCHNPQFTTRPVDIRRMLDRPAIRL
jgi:hypothetical protein